MNNARLIRVLVSMGFLVSVMIYIGVKNDRVLPFILAGWLVVFGAIGIFTMRRGDRSLGAHVT